jgi:hypothetical protein
LDFTARLTAGFFVPVALSHRWLVRAIFKKAVQKIQADPQSQRLT